MIIRDERMIQLKQTIVYKNKNLEFVNFTDNALDNAGVKSEDYLLGKKDIDMPWDIYSEAYQEHDRDAFSGKTYSVITPFINVRQEYFTMLCTRSECIYENEPHILVTVVDLTNQELQKIISNSEDIRKRHAFDCYYLGKQIVDIQFTPREEQCLFFMIRGESSKTIAKVMGISYKTVGFHIDNIKEKLGCKSRSEAISIAIQMGYLSIIPSFKEPFCTEDK